MVFIGAKQLLELFWVDSMVDFDVGWIWGGLLKKNEGEMEKSAISRQNSRKGIGTHCVEGMWYQYQKLWVSVPTHSEGLVPVPIKVVPVPMLPTTLFLYPLHC